MRMNKQYQGEKKLLSKYVKINGQKIHHYFSGVIYENDIFETRFDFEEGEEKITSYEPNKNNSDEYKKNLKNIVGAFAVAYLPNGLGGYSKVQKLIDRKRINEAIGCSKAGNFWRDWPDRMVLKTAYHDLFKDMQSFIDPEILRSEDFKIINSSEENRYSNTIDVEANVKEEAGTYELNSGF